MFNSFTNELFKVPLPLRLSGSALKIIAVLSMLTDHCAYYMMEHGSPLYEVLRCVGRIAFPVFAFLIAEGFAHTRNRIRYSFIILGFALISEIPWFILNGVDGTHNVMFTLFLGVVALAIFERLCEDGLLCCLSILLIGFLAWWSGVDYDWHGILMIVIFYMLRFRTMNPWICRNKICYPLQAMLQTIFTFPLMMHYGIIGAILASTVIFLYDGTRGKIRGPYAKYSFYAIYPFHLMIFALMP